MDKEQLYQQIREFTSEAGLFTVAEIMTQFGVNYGAAREAVKKLEDNKLAALKDKITFEYIGVDRKTVKDKPALIKALLDMGEALDPLFCDAVSKCAKVGEISPVIIMSELPVSFERAVSLTRSICDIGFCKSKKDSPIAMAVSYADVSEIVNEYRNSRIIVAPDDSNSFVYWQSDELESEVKKQIEHMCDWYMDGDCEFMLGKAAALAESIRAAGDNKNAELADAIVKYLEECTKSESNRNALYAIMRNRIGMIKMSFMLDGLSDDYERLWPMLKTEIVNFITANIGLDNTELVMRAREEKSLLSDNKTEDNILKRIALNKIEYFSPLDFYIFREETQK